MTIVDRLGRRAGSLRVSVTDRCNLRCRYCMPEDEYVWLPRPSILTFEEITRLARIFAVRGVDKIRLTGGEPLLRHDLPELVRMLRTDVRASDIALTTNGLLLPRMASALRDAGLTRITVSLDTLRPERFSDFTRRARLADVLAGIRAQREAGFTRTKLNAVVVRGFNDDELIDLLEFGRREQVEVRFIEYMDVGGATQWQQDQVVSRREMLDRIGRHYGGVTEAGQRGAAPAERFLLSDGTEFGIIASTTTPFCRDCDRSRLTADGMWFLCLYADAGIDLRGPLRAGAGDAEIGEMLDAAWSARSDRGAELRASQEARGALYQLGTLRRDPHREMHTRGG